MGDETYGTTHTAAGDCSTGMRNRFFRGKQMKAEDYLAEQQYFLGRRRLINRAVLGWGVVHGLPATNASAPEPGPIVVGPGLAIDRHGREIALTAPVTLDPATTFIAEEGASGCQPRPIDKATAGVYVLAIHYAERRFGDAHLPDDCGCAGADKKAGKKYVCETAVFSLTKIYDQDGAYAKPAKPCPCAEGPCTRTCRCGAPSSCGCGSGRGPHACLCRWVVDAKVAGEPTRLCEWRGFELEPSDGVGLACVTVSVVDGKCGPEWVGVIEDDCSPRRLVKNNDLLYDLIRGCDLTRIAWVSWAEWHRLGETQVAWGEFAKKFEKNGRTDFVVRFSAPVRTATLQRDVIVITAITKEPGTGWRAERRVPIAGLDLTPDKAALPDYTELPDGTTNQMRVLVHDKWVADEIELGRESWLSERDFRIEIEILGDYILDCHGQAVDANALGLKDDVLPTGNGTPGGTFHSNFRVQHRTQHGSYDAA